jgi:hypothetical protein
MTQTIAAREIKPHDSTEAMIYTLVCPAEAAAGLNLA